MGIFWTLSIPWTNASRHVGCAGWCWCLQWVLPYPKQALTKVSLAPAWCPHLYRNPAKRETCSCLSQTADEKLIPKYFPFLESVYLFHLISDHCGCGTVWDQVGTGMAPGAAVSHRPYCGSSWNAPRLMSQCHSWLHGNNMTSAMMVWVGLALGGQGQRFLWREVKCPDRTVPCPSCCTPVGHGAVVLSPDCSQGNILAPMSSAHLQNLPPFYFFYKLSVFFPSTNL